MSRAVEAAPTPVTNIQNAANLAPFFRSLAQTEKKRRITRISHYGASILGSDGPSSVTRHALWKRFGNAGKGWVNIAPGWKWYLPRDVKFKSSGWKGRTVVNHRLSDGRYGFGGVAAIGSLGSKTVLKADAERLELWFKSSPKSGRVSVTIDKREPEVFSIAAETERDGWKSFRLGAGKHTITVKAAGGGAVRLYGATLEKGKYGVVYDTIPLIGARGSRIIKFDETHLATQVAHRGPDLIIANFGGNELVDERMNMAVYKRQYRTAMSRLFAGGRAGGTKAACLVMGPTDHARKRDGRVRKDPQLPKIIAIQRALAKELGCGFFDSAAATGGLGSSISTQRSKEPLYYRDYAHLTPAGNKVLGTQTHLALVAAYEAWKRAK